jgi:hypothetical protein
MAYIVHYYSASVAAEKPATATASTPAESPGNDEVSVPAVPQTATPTASTVLVNSRQVAFDAYNINGNNYFKLRDLANTLNGTEKQFEVGWDSAANAISLTSGRAYTAVGGEMEGKGAGSQTATPTASKITLDGAAVNFTAYNIGGNNYFKLRDIGEAFNFGVDWDGASKTIAIDTNKAYTAETAEETVSTSADSESASATVPHVETFSEILKNGTTIIESLTAMSEEYDDAIFYENIESYSSMYGPVNEIKRLARDARIAADSVIELCGDDPFFGALKSTIVEMRGHFDGIERSSFDSIGLGYYGTAGVQALGQWVDLLGHYVDVAKLVRPLDANITELANTLGLD